MPFGAMAHLSYWPGSTAAPPAAQPGTGHYQLWQTVPTNVAFSGLAWMWYPLVWLWNLCRWSIRLACLTREQAGVVDRAYHLITSPLFYHARESAKDTAQTLGFRREKAWSNLANQIKQRADWAENTYRHLHACQQYDKRIREQGSTMTGPEIHFIVEMGYQSYAMYPRASS